MSSYIMHFRKCAPIEYPRVNLKSQMTDLPLRHNFKAALFQNDTINSVILWSEEKNVLIYPDFRNEESGTP